MLIIPVAAFIFIGGSYFLANRFLPSNMALKATPWMAAAALASYFVTQFLAALIVGASGIPVAQVGVPIFVGISLLGSVAGAALVLRAFVSRHRRRKAEKQIKAAAFD